MSSRIKVILDDLATLLNSGTWTQSFTAERIYYRDTPLDQLDTLRVWVMPSKSTLDTYSRGANLNTIDATVQIVQNIDPTDDNAIDDLIAFVESVTDFLNLDANHELTNGATRTGDAATIDPVYDFDNLKDNRVFLSEITVSYGRTVSR